MTTALNLNAPPDLEERRTRRKLEGAAIDPATAETIWWFGQTLDPYGDFGRLSDELSCIGREYFARRPGGSWIHSSDIPEETRRALWPSWYRHLDFPDPDIVSAGPTAVVIDASARFRDNRGRRG